MRFRAKLACWILRRCLPEEVYAVISRNIERMDPFPRSVVARIVARSLTPDDLKAHWHQCGLLLNIEKDGRLDLGRSKEGN